MATELNMTLLLRRGQIPDSYVLEKGEPGYHTGTKAFKIGDGTTTWKDLDIANKAQIDALIKVVSDELTSFKGNYDTKIPEIEKSINDLAAIVEALDGDYATDDELKGVKEALEASIGEITAEIAGYGDIVSRNAAEFATAAQGAKADAAAVKADVDQAFTDTNKAITDLEAFVGEIPETAKAKNIVAYVQEKTAGIATDAALEELTGRVAGAESAITAINNEETGVLAQAKAYTDAGDIFVTDMLTVDKFGGIAGGADLNGKTTHQILTDLLYPYIAFVINSSSRSDAAATLECGKSQTLSSATINVTKKKDPITSIKLLNGSTILEEKTGDAVANGGTIKFDGFDPITVTKSNNPNLKFTVTDGTTSTDKSVGASTFVYPYYWGVCAADATINEALVEGLTKKVETKANKSVTYTCANERMVFAYPKVSGYTALKSILDPNNFEIIDGFTCHEVNITGLDGTAVTYYVYVSTAGTSTNFKVQFKY